MVLQETGQRVLLLWKALLIFLEQGFACAALETGIIILQYRLATGCPVMLAALEIIFEKQAGLIQVLPRFPGPAPQQIFRTRWSALLPAGPQLRQQVTLQ